MEYFHNLFFTVHGRINRSQWWFGNFILFIGYIFAHIMFFVLNIHFIIAGLFAFVIFIAKRVPLNMKRWHDRDKSGWWVLIELIPVFGSLWTLVELGFFPSKNAVTNE